jgi:hypothetical protein
MYGIHQDYEHPGFHPELDHKFDDMKDVTPMEFHDHVVEHAPDLKDHHSYHIEQFPQFHNWPIVHHDHGPIFHGQYQFQHHDWTSPSFTGVTDLEAHEKIDDPWKHVDTLPEFKPDFGMDLPYDETTADRSTEPAPKRSSRKPAQYHY